MRSDAANLVAALAPFATLATVLTGVVFGSLTIRQWQQTRSLTAAVELVHTIQTAEFARSLQLVLELPEDADARRVLEDPAMLAAAYVVSHGIESLGVLVYHRLLPLHLVDHLIGGSVRAAWRRLHGYFEDRRTAVGVMLGEWFQWLAERLEEQPAPGKALGAAAAYRRWRA